MCCWGELLTLIVLCFIVICFIIQRPLSVFKNSSLNNHLMNIIIGLHLTLHTEPLVGFYQNQCCVQLVSVISAMCEMFSASSPPPLFFYALYLSLHSTLLSSAGFQTQGPRTVQAGTLPPGHTARHVTSFPGVQKQALGLFVPLHLYWCSEGSLVNLDASAQNSFVALKDLSYFPKLPWLYGFFFKLHVVIIFFYYKNRKAGPSFQWYHFGSG